MRTILVGILGYALTFFLQNKINQEPGGDLILPPPAQTKQNDLPEVCLIIAQGAKIKPDQYKSLALEIQKQASSHFHLWVGIPEFLGDFAEPLVLNHGIDRVLKKMKKLGMVTNTTIAAGHSLGGAMIQSWTPKHTDKVKGQILLGAYLTRSWKKNYIFNYAVPTLTIGGELDGLTRLTRIVEAFHTQLLDPSQDPVVNRLAFPVTVIKGVSHMQFADGDIPSAVFNRDLIPEVTYEVAHQAIASDAVTFMRSLLKGDEKAQKDLHRRLDETQKLVQSILDSLYLEGYHNFRPPCLCKTDICQPHDNCTAACPFTQLYSQKVMAGKEIAAKGLKINNTDSFHDMWETKPQVHHPVVYNNCTSPAGCTLQTSSVTQGMYHTGQDLEIWEIHFNVPQLDFAYFPISARELKTKLTSRQSIYSHAGIPNPDYKTLDAGKERCKEINQFSWDWAREQLTNHPTVLKRFVV